MNTVLGRVKLRDKAPRLGVLPSVHSPLHQQGNISHETAEEPGTGKMLPAMIGEAMVSPPGEDRNSLGGHLWDGEREIKLLGFPARRMLNILLGWMDRDG